MDEGPGEHDAHLMDDDLEQTVPCARCGEHVWSYTQRCPHCGVHYSGEAWQFELHDGRKQHTSSRWCWLIVVLLVLGLLAIVTSSHVWF